MSTEDWAASGLLSKRFIWVLAPQYECCMSGPATKDTPETYTHYGTRRPLHKGLKRDSLENYNMDCEAPKVSKQSIAITVVAEGILEKCMNVTLGDSANGLITRD